MNNKPITVMTTIIIAISAAILLPTYTQAQTTTYHSGWVWSDHTDHTNELDANGSVPVALVTSKLDDIGKAQGTRPVTMNIYYTMLHKVGHFIGLCGTYQGDNQSSGDCTTVTSTDTAMSSYPWGAGDRAISSSDKQEVNSKY